MIDSRENLIYVIEACNPAKQQTKGQVNLSRGGGGHCLLSMMTVCAMGTLTSRSEAFPRAMHARIRALVSRTVWSAVAGHPRSTVPSQTSRWACPRLFGSMSCTFTSELSVTAPISLLNQVQSLHEQLRGTRSCRHAPPRFPEKHDFSGTSPQINLL